MAENTKLFKRKLQRDQETKKQKLNIKQHFAEKRKSTESNYILKVKSDLQKV